MKDRYFYICSTVLLACGLLLIPMSLAEESYEQYFARANEASQSGRFEEAIRFYEKVLEINPDFSPAYIELGKIYEQRTDDVEAIAWYFRSALRIDPDNIESYEHLGRAYQKANQPDQSEKYFKKVLELDPNSLSVQYSLAWTYLMGQSKPEEAIGYFKEVIEKTKLPMAYYGMGLAYSQMREHAGVLEVVTELKSIGQVDLASKLENSIREPWAPTPQTLQIPVSQSSSSVVRASPPPAPAVPSSSAVTPVRLRGKLFNIENNPTQGDH